MRLGSRSERLERTLMLKSLLPLLFSLLVLCLCRSISEQCREVFWIQLAHSCSRGIGWYGVLAFTTHLAVGLLVLLMAVDLWIQETRVVSRGQLCSLDIAVRYCNAGYLGCWWSVVRLSFSLFDTIQVFTSLKDLKEMENTNIYKEIRLHHLWKSCM